MNLLLAPCPSSRGLLQWDRAKGKKHEQGIAYLNEACQTFTDCKADLDLKLVERALAEHK